MWDKVVLIWIVCTKLADLTVDVLFMFSIFVCELFTL